MDQQQKKPKEAVYVAGRALCIGLSTSMSTAELPVVLAIAACLLDGVFNQNNNNSNIRFLFALPLPSSTTAVHRPPSSEHPQLCNAEISVMNSFHSNRIPMICNKNIPSTRE